MSAVRTVWTIARRELAGYFISPVAYVFLVIFLLLTGFFTFTVGAFFERGEASLASFFVWHPWLYLVLVPAVGMRVWSEERRAGTIELLLTMPVATWQAILAKFLASWVFLAIALALTFPVVLTVNYLGSPDNGVIVAAYFGSLLLAGGFLAVGTCMSALSRSQVVAFILGVAACFVLLLAGYPLVLDAFRGWAPQTLIEAVASLSLLTHFQSITRGVLEARDVLYFAMLIAFFLFTTTVAIDLRKAD